MSLISILFGVGLLFLGRKAFWMFVAGAGFVAGLSLANRLLEVPESVAVIIGLAIGLFAAMLAIAVQRFAIGLAGFLIGGYIALQTLPMFALDGGWGATVVTFLIGGLVGIILINMFLGWALILLSSLAGAALIVNALGMEAGLGTLVFIVLVVVGVIFQARKLRESGQKRR